ncbi:inositol monophosphatase family protein [Rhodoferax sp.]|uniref:inositol monophosphatase family protein n=1 Tax=Rhodoferax sp. TaxID=50421 RepID=UPI00261C67A5|nr:inositol monophosphatase family protein [Rhodoferax sp.]MDD2810258.1 inositol monophosphatase family protein [Rhodoferax sp.]
MVNPTPIEGLIEKALDIGEAALRSRDLSPDIHEKESTRDFATNVDISVERAISKFLCTHTPEVPIVGEELSPNATTSVVEREFWVIDPIDGTANFSRDIPLFGICITLIRDGQAFACGVSFPSLGERYVGIRGKGAFLNGDRLSVSGRVRMETALVGFGDFAVGTLREEKNKFRYELISRLGNDCLRVRMLGSAALQLAWLAAGRLDISVTMSNRAWDVQAGVLLVREAGGLVFDGDGSEHCIASACTLASNGATLKEQLLVHFSATDV